MTISTDDEKRAALKEKLEREINRALVGVTTWGAQFANQPDRAATHLEYSDDLFEAAARVRVFRAALRTLEQTATYELATQHMLRSLLERARVPTKSTSTSANLLYQSVCSAWADVVDMIQELNH